MHRYRHPRGQTASAVSGIEGGGPARDLPGPTQGVLSLVQVQVTLNTGRLRHEPPSISAPTELLEAADDGGKGRRVL